MQSNKRPFRLRNVPFYAFFFILSFVMILLIMTAFFKLVEMVIPEQWKGGYHGFIVRLYSNFPSPALL